MWGFCSWSLICYAVVSALSNISIILMGKRERAGSVDLSHGDGGLECVNVIVYDHSHLLC